MEFQKIKYFYMLYLIIFVQVLTSYAQTRYFKSSAIRRNYDTQHIKLELKFNEQEKSLTGKSTLTIVPIENNFNRCTFHAKNMEIKDVLLDNIYSLEFLADSEVVVIDFPQKYSPKDSLQISIFYYTVPERGIYFNKPTEKDPKSPHQIFSHSEPIDARYWFPCYDAPDDKLTSEIIATVKDQYFLLSNGRLLEIIENQEFHTKTYHWLQDKPHVTYLISIVTGEYELIDDNYKDLPIQYYVYKDHLEDAPLYFSKTPKMIDVFSQKFGYLYPWDKYAQIVIHNYKSKGMEHTSATSLLDKIIYDQRTHLGIKSDRLITHELAHQWFGNLVTCKDWKHLWLNEGLATYAEIIFSEIDQGVEAAQYDVIKQQKFYLKMEESDFHQPVVYDNYLHPEDMFNHISYQKASQVLHMLRNIIGDELFFKSIVNYLQKFAFQSVVTIDFIKIIEETTGENLNWFFDQWLYQGGHPEFEVSYEWLVDSKSIILNVNQVQQDSFQLAPIFQMPVEIEIVTKNNILLEKREIKSRQETMRFHVDSKPLMIRFDKNNIILKSLKFIKTQDECIYQLLHDNNLWGRLDAINQLQQNTIDTMATIKALTTALLRDPFWAVRRDAAYQLEVFENEQLKDVFITGYQDPNPRVRAACIQNLGYFKDSQLFSFFKNVAESDSSYWVISEALYALIKISDSLSYEFLNKFINMDSYDDVIQSAAFEGFRNLKDKKCLPTAVKFALDRDLPFPRRYSALKLIEEIGIGDFSVEESLIKLLHDRDDKIRQKVIQILGEFRTKNALLALKQLEQEELRDSVRRRVIYAIKKIEKSFNDEE